MAPTLVSIPATITSSVTINYKEYYRSTVEKEIVDFVDGNMDHGIRGVSDGFFEAATYKRFSVLWCSIQR